MNEIQADRVLKALSPQSVVRTNIPAEILQTLDAAVAEVVMEWLDDSVYASCRDAESQWAAIAGSEVGPRVAAAREVLDVLGSHGALDDRDALLERGEFRLRLPPAGAVVWGLPPVLSVAVLVGEGRTIYAGLRSGELSVIDFNGSRERQRLALISGAIYNVALSKDGNMLAAASTNDLVVLSLPDLGELFRISIEPVGGAEVYEATCAFFPDGLRLLWVPDGEPRIIDIASQSDVLDEEGDGLQIAPDGYPSNAMTICDDGRHIITANDDGTMRVWDMDNEVEVMFGDHDNIAATCCTAFDDPTVIATGCLNGTLRVWNLRTKSELMCIQAHDGPTLGVIVTPADDGFDQLISWREELRVWNRRTGELLGTMRSHTGTGLPSCAVLPGTRNIISGGRDGSIICWDLPGPDPQVPDAE